MRHSSDNHVLPRSTTPSLWTECCHKRGVEPNDGAHGSDRKSEMFAEGFEEKALGL